uniref:G domain-containing protein n=1 Tax=Odontella aurita TaxID=265563 RepID=A0A7S4INT5_9STRA|mmetsp:Transcript_27954/g.82179  ORF Transcript_27954/g.82179 Transcript_27954/m.82179 type:complete len:449 (+) Transcript_27954:582-1928(+)
MNQLKFVVQRRRFGLGVLVLDATDSEHSVVPNIRNAIGKIPLVVVWNKIDLMPRFNRYDQVAMSKSIKKNVRPIASFAVSAKTQIGLVDLSEYLMQNLKGRDVFIMGAANVGKSTLVKSLAEILAQSIFLKGSVKEAHRRKEQASSLKVTGSHLPGTTLQAVRIPCFSSDRHALWDTPGILNNRSLQYQHFPAHLMEPLSRPERIEIPTKEGGRVYFLKPGYTLLIESTWMRQEIHMDTNDNEHAPSGQDEECVLARIDLVAIDAHCGRPHARPSGAVMAQAYLHPSLRVRMVPISEAPDRATIPTSHIQGIQQKIRKATGHSDAGLEDEYGLPLKAFKDPKHRPDGSFRPGPKERGNNGKYYMDIVFPSLGWIALTNESGFTTIPHCVDGSVFSKRKSIYPTNLLSIMDEEGLEHQYEPEAMAEEGRERIRRAAREGRHSVSSAHTL